MDIVSDREILVPIGRGRLAFRFVFWTLFVEPSATLVSVVTT